MTLPMSYLNSKRYTICAVALHIVDIVNVTRETLKIKCNILFLKIVNFVFYLFNFQNFRDKLKADHVCPKNDLFYSFNNTLKGWPCL